MSFNNEYRLPVVSAEQMRAADNAFVEQTGLPSSVLMENAGRQIAQFLLDEYKEESQKGVLFFCGAGNNGGDGFAAARVLHNLGIPTAIYRHRQIEELTGDALLHYQALCCLDDLVVFADESWKEFSAGLYVDALCGTGMLGSIREDVALVIESVNHESQAKDVTVVAVDIPSGVASDTGAIEGVAIQASATICLQALKWGNVLSPGAEASKSTYIADIGIPSCFSELRDSGARLLNLGESIALFHEHDFSKVNEHKGSRGRVVVIGGSPGVYGAAIMAATSAYAAGAGMVYAVLPRKVVQLYSAHNPEIMCVAGIEDDSGFLADIDDEWLAHIADAVVLGPGLGVAESTVRVVRKTLAACNRSGIPCVVDADALNCVSWQEELKEYLTEHTVITPHPVKWLVFLEFQL